MRSARAIKVAHAHLRYLNPMPRNTGDVLKRYKKVLVPELNGGQLRLLLRAKFLVDAVGLNKVQGGRSWSARSRAKIDEMMLRNLTQSACGVAALSQCGR